MQIVGFLMHRLNYDSVHAPVSRQTLPAVAAEKLSDLHGLADSYDIIGIDEGQFVSLLYSGSQLELHMLS